MSGQVGAIQLGISRALQNWEPAMRPPLRDGNSFFYDLLLISLYICEHIFVISEKGLFTSFITSSFTLAHKNQFIPLKKLTE